MIRIQHRASPSIVPVSCRAARQESVIGLLGATSMISVVTGPWICTPLNIKFVALLGR